jgi:formylmethanofuran dehydrogenase subunit D
VAPFFNTRASVDVLLAAGAQAGGKAALAFKDEVEYIQSKLAGLVDAHDGYFPAADMATFWVEFQQHGGWWQNSSSLGAPTTAGVLDQSLQIPLPEFDGDGKYFLYPFVSPILGEAGANKPWLQEVPDPTTTVMWNSWLEINPKTAEDLGVTDDDVVKVISTFGEFEISVLVYPAIHPNVVAIPFGQGHSAYGRYAENRGVNPLSLLGKVLNGAGDLAFAGIKVKIEKTGKKQPLSRLEGYTRMAAAEKKA